MAGLENVPVARVTRIVYSENQLCSEDNMGPVHEVKL